MMLFETIKMVTGGSTPMNPNLKVGENERVTLHSSHRRHKNGRGCVWDL